MQRVFTVAALAIALAIPSRPAAAQVRTWDFCFDQATLGYPGGPRSCIAVVAFYGSAQNITLKFWDYSGVTGTNSAPAFRVSAVGLLDVKVLSPLVPAATYQIRIGPGSPAFSYGAGKGGIVDYPNFSQNACDPSRVVSGFAVTPCTAPDFTQYVTGWGESRFDFSGARPDITDAIVAVELLSRTTDDYNTCASTGRYPQGADPCDVVPGSLFDPISVPEPSTYAMLSVGLAGLLFLRRRRDRKAM